MKSTAGVVQANGVSSFSPFPVHILPHFFHPVCLALVEPCSSREHKFNNDSLPALRTSPPLSARCPRFARNLNSANKASLPSPLAFAPARPLPRVGRGKLGSFSRGRGDGAAGLFGLEGLLDNSLPRLGCGIRQRPFSMYCSPRESRIFPRGRTNPGSPTFSWRAGMG